MQQFITDVDGVIEQNVNNCYFVRINGHLFHTTQEIINDLRKTRTYDNYVNLIKKETLFPPKTTKKEVVNNEPAPSRTLEELLQGC